MIDETEKNPLAENEDDVDPMLGDLAELLAERLGAGQPVDIEEIAGKYTALADSIRRLVPTIHDLVTVGRSMRDPPRREG